VTGGIAKRRETSRHPAPISNHVKRCWGEEKDERHAPAVVAFVAGIFAGHFAEPNFCMTYVLQDLFL
jgi:hypothetical protein